jgi:8-hydroxy-5-deazaflavin:NADPH oxidoreductase
MEVAVIGAGNVGGALAGSISRAGHTVTITSPSGRRAEEVGRETGAKVISSNREAVEGADAVVLAVPTHAVDQFVGEVGDALDGKIVIDVTNRMNPQEPPSTIDGTSNAERIQVAVPGARVIKAFNTAFAVRQADPVVDGTPIDGLVAGDDEAAKREVLDLVEGIGFRPIDAGSLGMARALEAMATLIISLNMANNWSWQNGWKLVGPLGSAAPGR